jgi:ornithine cyclodeaminase
MRIIDARTVHGLIDMPGAIAAMRRAFAALGATGISAPPAFHLEHPVAGEIHIKGAHFHGSRWMVTKVVSSEFAVPGNHGCFLILSADSGAIEVLVDDGGWLTEIRTAAAGALSVDLLARRDAQALAIIGAGVQAGFQLDAARTVRKFSDVRVASRAPERARAFADAHGVRACASVAEAIDGADVVICATTSREVVLDHVEAGVHVTSIGVDSAGKREAGPSLIAAADCVAVDDTAVAHQIGLMQGLSDRPLTTLGALVRGDAPGRVAATDVTLAGLSGLGVQDAAIAELLMERLPQR